MKLRNLVCSISLTIILSGCYNLKKVKVNDKTSFKYKISVSHDRVFNSNLPKYTYKIKKIYRQPGSNWFVQGLFYDKGSIYVSCGLWGKSKLVKWSLSDSKVIKSLNLDDKYFAEGITVLDNKLYQLTYKKHICFIYNLDTLKMLDSFKYYSDGWGLTNDGKYLLRSDGSNLIYTIDPDTYKITKTIYVHDNVGPVNNINAMDYINGKIYANIYFTPFIAEISPDNGMITAWISLEGINDKEYDTIKHHVPNGITHIGNDLLISGKNWSNIYQISLNEM